jgi:hypothetical protein
MHVKILWGNTEKQGLLQANRPNEIWTRKKRQLKNGSENNMA